MPGLAPFCTLADIHAHTAPRLQASCLCAAGLGTLPPPVEQAAPPPKNLPQGPHLLDDLLWRLPRAVDVAQHALDQVEVHAAGDGDAEVEQGAQARVERVDALQYDHAALGHLHGAVPHAPALLEVVDGHLGGGGARWR